MAKFNAATAVEAMEFDFTAYGGPTGIIPEPSREAVSDFYACIAQAARTVKGINEELKNKDPDSLTEEEIETLAKNTEGTALALEEGFYEALVGVTSGVIPEEIFRTLPHRVLQAFALWLAKELNPERPGPATTR